MPANFDGKLSFLKGPDGSCEICNGKAKIWCGINGPGDIQSSKRLFDKMNIIFSINRLAVSKNIEVSKSNVGGGGGGSSTKSSSVFSSTAPNSSSFVESIVRAAVDVGAYPRTALQVCAQEIKTDGPSDSALLNGLCLALLDAGIRMRHLFVAFTVVKVESAESKETKFIVEPSALTFASAAAIFLFVFQPSLTEKGGGAVIASDAHGRFTAEDFKLAKDTAQSECLPLFDLYRRKVFEKFAHNIVK